jgi:hypothetical protein
VIAVPFPNIALARHPAFRRSMADLELPEHGLR